MFNFFQNLFKLDCVRQVMNEVAVSLVFPVIDEAIWLCRRGTPPYEGLFSPVGGKIDAKQPSILEDGFHYVTKPGGARVGSVVDCFNNMLGIENTKEAAIRELAEEIFSGRKYPDEFREMDFSDVVRVPFSIVETFGDTLFRSYIHFARLNRDDFSLSPREVKDFKPITEINGGVTPIASYVLRGVDSASHCFGSDYFDRYPNLKGKDIESEHPMYSNQVDPLLYH